MAGSGARGQRSLATVSAAEAGIAQATIDSLQPAAEATKSDALLILRDGKVVHEWTYEGFRMPFNPQSVTKAISGLGVGVLLDRGAITTLDLPLKDVFPEFAAPGKDAVTLRMLMNHTSGLAADRGERQFMDQPDAGAFVRGRPMVEPAGTTFRYSNVGAQLVSHVVQARAGAPLHALLDSTVLGPMCIQDWRWDTDAKGATYGYSRIHLKARDLAAIGQLVLDGGEWRGQRVLSAATIDTLTAIRGGPVRGIPASAFVGLWQYWGGDSLRLDAALFQQLAAVPVSDTLLRVVRDMAGTSGERMVSSFRFVAVLDSVFGAGGGVARWERETRGRVVVQRWRSPAQAVGHSGSWGQWLLVFPETRTVLVRFASWSHPGRRSEDDGYSWNSIVGDTYRLLGRRP